MNFIRNYWIYILLAIILSSGIYLYFHKTTQGKINNSVIEFNKGNLDDAIRTAESVLESDPNNIQALLAIAATYAQKGSVTFKEEENAKKAIEYTDRVISLDNKNSEAYRIKGYAYEIQELYSDAHINYNKAIELDSKNYQAYSNKGHAFDLEGDIARAEEWYRKSIEINPSNDHGLLNLGRLYIRKENFDEALITLDSLLSTTPNSRMKGEAYQLIAYIKYNQEDFDGALEAINKALQFDNTMSTAWVSKAKIELGTALDMGTEEELNALIVSVKSSVDKALAINPNQAEAYLVLSDIEIITGNKSKEDEYKRIALEAIPLDITLGKKEKEAMKNYIETQIEVTSSSSELNNLSQ